MWLNFVIFRLPFFPPTSPTNADSHVFLPEPQSSLWNGQLTHLTLFWKLNSLAALTSPDGSELDFRLFACWQHKEMLWHFANICVPIVKALGLPHGAVLSKNTPHRQICVSIVRTAIWRPWKWFGHERLGSQPKLQHTVVFLLRLCLVGSYKFEH